MLSISQVHETYFWCASLPKRMSKLSQAPKENFGNFGWEQHCKIRTKPLIAKVLQTWDLGDIVPSPKPETQAWQKYVRFSARAPPKFQQKTARLPCAYTLTVMRYQLNSKKGQFIKVKLQKRNTRHSIVRALDLVQALTGNTPTLWHWHTAFITSEDHCMPCRNRRECHKCSRNDIVASHSFKYQDRVRTLLRTWGFLQMCTMWGSLSISQRC